MGGADDAARALSDVLDVVKQGSLRVFGDWFGKPFDNWHVPVSASADGDVLVVGFHDDEELRVREPAGWLFTRDAFRIQHASRVTWRWYSYGRPKVLANWLSVEYQVDAGGRVRVRSYDPFDVPPRQASTVDAAVELLTY
jgi:hypothetical protein